jgi:hypothetical protein
MTCREKLAMEHPDKINPSSWGGCEFCPSTYGYLEDYREICGNKYSGEKACRICWDREIPEEKVTKGSLQRLGESAKKIAESAVKATQAFRDTSEAIAAIKDSGDRTEFETGAVRDMREGKGRCDLMPLEVVSDILASPIVLNISRFQDTNRTEFLHHAIERFAIDCYYKDTEAERSSRLNAHMFLEVAKHFEEGAKKYGENNWQKGIPVHCYIDSAVRHYLKWLRGDTDEPHDRAFVWNLMCCIWEVDYRNKEEK